MKSITLTLRNIRGIADLSIDLPLKPGVFALTGLNGTGKSTVLMALSPRLRAPVEFKMFQACDYNESSSIRYSIGNDYEEWHYKDGWRLNKSEGKIKLNGFYEGSLMRGTRFFNTDNRLYQRLQNVNEGHLRPVDDFIKNNMSQILHGNTLHYNSLLRLNSNVAKEVYQFPGVPYFIRKSDGVLLTQFDLSTGEFLLLRFLHLLYNLIIVVQTKYPRNQLILVDEVELALHPSAIYRLLNFSQAIAERHNVTIIFATHSLEIIHNLEHTNLIYLQADNRGNVSVLESCYPAYITLDIYRTEGYDLVILVEDILAYHTVQKIIKDESIGKHKRIQVLPVGGYEETLTMHENLLKGRTLRGSTKILSIIDGDVKTESLTLIRQNRKSHIWNEVDESCVLFLPIDSIEKYMKRKLFDEKDIIFARKLRDNFIEVSDIFWFLPEYLANIEEKKKHDTKHSTPIQPDIAYFRNGKNLYGIVQAKAKIYGKDEALFRKELCSLICDEQPFNSFRGVLSERVQAILG